MSSPSEKLSSIKDNTQSVYERQGEHWHHIRRNELFDKHWLDLFLDTVPKGGTLLDLGCGSGRPVAGYCISKGFRVTGIDYATTMITLARETYPNSEWQVADIRDYSPETLFDGVYSWDGFFHLSIPEQRQALPRLSSWVKPGGSLLLTVGPEEGEVTGKIGEDIVYHASLSPDDYKERLNSLGFSRVEFLSKGTDEPSRCALLATQKLTR